MLAGFLLSGIENLVDRMIEIWTLGKNLLCLWHCSERFFRGEASRAV